MPVDNVADLLVAGVHPVRAATGVVAETAPYTDPPDPPLETVDLTILSGWADAVAEAEASASPEVVAAVVADAHAGAAWRATFGIAAPSEALATAIETLDSGPSEDDPLSTLAALLLASAREVAGSMPMPRPLADREHRDRLGAVVRDDAEPALGRVEPGPRRRHRWPGHRGTPAPGRDRG